jgi:sensor histidine kinase YesM
VGLKNTESRLRNTYGPGALLHIQASEQGYSVSFFIPLNEEEQQLHTEPQLHKQAV